MNARRRFLQFALAPAALAPAQSIYIPERQKETDRETILSFLDEFSFAMVITGAPHVQVTNVPTLFDRGPADGWGRLWWHLAKNNAQNEAMNGEVVVAFHGPHGYISPNWYESKNAVPTWNFATVQVTGRPRRLDDDAQIAAGLRRLVMKNEARYGGGTKWKFDDLPDSYLKGMRQGVIGYEMAIERVEAKFKLGHERSPADREGVLRGLARSPKERGLTEFTRAHYERK